jgi:FixJ family two-component response regulator
VAALLLCLARPALVTDINGQMAELRRRYASLTQREREVMTLVVTGLLNKQIAAQLRTSEATVRARRAQAHAEDGSGLRGAVSEDRGRA